MSRIRFDSKALAAGLTGIRARIVLIALILVVPLMLERVRSLEHARTQQMQAATDKLVSLARQSAMSQREVLTSAQSFLRAAALHVASPEPDCNVLALGQSLGLPWLRSVSIIGGDGIVKCSTIPDFAGTNLSDRPYLRSARERRDFVLSDYIFGRGSKEPIVVAAFPVATVAPDDRSVVIASMNIDWLIQLLGQATTQQGISAYLINANGIVLATSGADHSHIGRPFEDPNLVSTVFSRTDAGNGDSFPYVSPEGRRQMVSFATVAGSARLVLSLDEATMFREVNNEVAEAYAQFIIVSLLLLLSAWFIAELLVVHPVRTLTEVANRFAAGDWGARAAILRLPTEFGPLANAFNSMASKLSEREQELLKANDQLLVLASHDPLSGIANRRGLQSRLDFEWQRGEQTGESLAVLMIDVDYFKTFNDTYGHREGDACLACIGALLGAAAIDAGGFAARYGGEEFCLLLPNTDSEHAAATGRSLLTAVAALDIAHAKSDHRRVTISVGVAAMVPVAAQTADSLIDAADAALYSAKHRGRNTLVEHGLIEPVEAPPGVSREALH